MDLSVQSVQTAPISSDENNGFISKTGLILSNQLTPTEVSILPHKLLPRSVWLRDEIDKKSRMSLAKEKQQSRVISDQVLNR